MSDDARQHETPDADAAPVPRDDPRWRRWSNLWQVPAILFSGVAIVLALWTASRGGPPIDYDARLDRAAAAIESEQLEDARARLGDLERTREALTPAQQARFHALVADGIVATQRVREVRVADLNQAIAEQYATATDMGGMLGVVRQERWANALLDLGDESAVRERIEDLEALAVTREQGPAARAARSRILRQLVERILDRPGSTFEERMAALETYRADERLEAVDLAWAIEQEARERIDAGDAELAVERLLLDIRRLEAGGDLPGATWGGLYVQLARGYEWLGALDDAEYWVNHALDEHFVGGEHAMGEALLLRASIARSHQELEDAIPDLDRVVAGWPGTEWHLPALLARAEVLGRLGRTDASFDDYRTLVERMRSEAGLEDGGVTPERVAGSLTDRHHAATLVGDLEEALGLVQLAERLFDVRDVPAGVLRSIAAVSRELALGATGGTPTSAAGQPLSVPMTSLAPAVRRIAAQHFERSADYFERHARAIVDVAGADDAWAESLWLAADGEDHAGRRDEAVRMFREYVSERPTSDPRHAAAAFRLARALDAELRTDEAIEAYRDVLARHPRTVEGTATHVPLARALERTGRLAEAEQHLLDVVEGRGAETDVTGIVTPVIGPAAADYRAALVELGRLLHARGDWTRAIERLQDAVARYPGHEDLDVVRCRLADAHARRAAEIASMLDAGEEPAPSSGQAPLRITPSRRSELQALARGHLERARDGFALVIEDWASTSPERLDRLRRQLERSAWMTQGEVLASLGDLRGALDVLDRASRRFHDHPASIAALVQMVMLYDRLGEAESAEVAHRNALARLDQLPDEAFEGTGSVLDREQWSRWLATRPAGTPRTASATGG